MLKKNKALVLLTIIFACMSCDNGKTGEAKAPTRVKTETTSAASTDGGEKYVGVVEERAATSVSFTSMGVVRRMFVNEGQLVSRGQLLAELDPTSMDNSVEAARATTSQAHDMVTQARNTYAQAQDAYDRLKKVYDNGVGQNKLSVLHPHHICQLEEIVIGPDVQLTGIVKERQHIFFYFGYICGRKPLPE